MSRERAENSYQDSEEIADLLLEQYVSSSRSPLPEFEQKNWALMIEKYRHDPESQQKAKDERDKLRNRLDTLIDQLIEDGWLKEISPMQRGEILEKAIKKLATMAEKRRQEAKKRERK